MRECGVLGSARLDGGTEVGGGLGRLVCSEYVHRHTQVGTIDNTTTAWVLDECNSPLLLSANVWSNVSKEGRVSSCSDHCAEYLSLKFRAQHLGFD